MVEICYVAPTVNVLTHALNVIRPTVYLKTRCAVLAIPNVHRPTKRVQPAPTALWLQITLIASKASFVMGRIYVPGIRVAASNLIATPN